MEKLVTGWAALVHNTMYHFINDLKMKETDVNLTMWTHGEVVYVT